MQIVNQDKQEIKSDQLEWNTYCIFTEEKQDISDVIGYMFQDYLVSLKDKE